MKELKKRKNILVTNTKIFYLFFNEHRVEGVRRGYKKLWAQNFLGLATPPPPPPHDKKKLPINN